MTEAIFISYLQWSNHYTQTSNSTPDSTCLASTFVSYRHRPPAEVNFLTISMLLFTPHICTHTHTKVWCFFWTSITRHHFRALI